MRTLTYQNMLEVLANYDLVHSDVKVCNLFGLCDTDTRKIYIAKEIGEVETISTIIHECIHGFNALHRLRDSERRVRELEKRTYRSLYGK